MNHSTIKNARTIGMLFLLAFITYGFGMSFFESTEKPYRFIGATLIAGNSIIVIFIGILLRRSLIHHNVYIGNLYLLTRLLEAVLLGSGLLSLFSLHAPAQSTVYILAMLLLGVGSTPMCVVFYKKKLTPNWIALWGIVGYALLAIGFFMDALGYSISMIMLIPGGLWEVSFAIWLIITRGEFKRSGATPN